MKALRLHAVNTAVRCDDVAVPTAGGSEVLVRVEAAGICGSDFHILHGHNPLPEYPRTLGHEIAGVIESVGSGVSGGRVGQRVAVNFLVSCGRCDWCMEGRSSLCRERAGLGVARDGGLAEYVTVPERNAIAVPDSVPLEHAAIATDAFATPLHAIGRSGVVQGEGCLVIGAGGLGLCAIQILTAMGAGPVVAVDRDERALKAARDAGAQTISSEELASATLPAIAHAFDFVGSALTVAAAVAAVDRGGRVNLVGLGDELEIGRGDHLVREEKTVAGSYSFENDEIRQVLNLMAEGRVNPDDVIGERVDLAEAGRILDPHGGRLRMHGRTIVELKCKVPSSQNNE